MHLPNPQAPLLQWCYCWSSTAKGSPLYPIYPSLKSTTQFVLSRGGLSRCYPEPSLPSWVLWTLNGRNCPGRGEREGHGPAILGSETHKCLQNHHKDLALVGTRENVLAHLWGCFGGCGCIVYQVFFVCLWSMKQSLL